MKKKPTRGGTRSKKATKKAPKKAPKKALKKAPKKAPKKATARPRRTARPAAKPAKAVAAPTKAPAAAIDAALWRAGPSSEEIGEIAISSGKVRVCDAGTLFAPVEVVLRAGTYQVRVARGKDGDNRAAVLAMAGATPTSWKRVGAYPVDAGMSGFFDADVFARVDAHQWPISIYDDLICDHLDPAEDEGHAGAFVPYEETKFSACRSGSGDGVYPVFAGSDAGGAIVAVVTTFD
jgi:hypothetical protein